MNTTPDIFNDGHGVPPDNPPATSAPETPPRRTRNTSPRVSPFRRLAYPDRRSVDPREERVRANQAVEAAKEALRAAKDAEQELNRRIRSARDEAFTTALQPLVLAFGKRLGTHEDLIEASLEALAAALADPESTARILDLMGVSTPLHE